MQLQLESGGECEIGIPIEYMEGIKIRYPEYCRDISALHPLPDTIPHSVSGMGKVVKKNLDKRIVYRYTEHG